MRFVIKHPPHKHRGEGILAPHPPGGAEQRGGPGRVVDLRIMKFQIHCGLHHKMATSLIMEILKRPQQVLQPQSDGLNRQRHGILGAGNHLPAERFRRIKRAFAANAEDRRDPVRGCPASPRSPDTVPRAVPGKPPAAYPGKSPDPAAAVREGGIRNPPASEDRHPIRL